GLYRDGDGTYRIDVRWRDLATGEPKRYREKLPPRTTAVAAKARAQGILAQIVAGTFEPNREAPVTLRAAFDRYLDRCRTHGIKSTRSRVTDAKAWCAFLGDKKPLSTIASFDAERFKAALRKKGKAPGTVNRHLTTMKGMLGWAAKEGLIDRGRAAE